jgi:hypothetical protein
MPSLIVAHVYMRRRDDPLDEFRELLLWQHEHHFAVEQVIGFMSNQDPVPICQRATLKIGSEHEMKRILLEESTRLKKEGFAITNESSLN